MCNIIIEGLMLKLIVFTWATNTAYKQVGHRTLYNQDDKKQLIKSPIDEQKNKQTNKQLIRNEL